MDHVRTDRRPLRVSMSERGGGEFTERVIEEGRAGLAGL